MFAPTGQATETTQQTVAASVATVAASQGNGATGVALPVGGVGILGWLSGIYNALKSTLTVSGTVAVSNQPTTIAVSNLPIDGTSLQAATIITAGNQASVNTAGYNSLTVSLTGQWVGGVQVMGSNDNVTFEPLLITDVATMDVVDYIASTGVFSVRCSTLYVQVAVSQILGSATLAIVGRVSSGVDAHNRLTRALDINTGEQLQVAVNGLNVDATKSLILSDGVPRTVIGVVGTPIIIPTAGYQSVGFTTGAGFAGALTGSNDGVNGWLAVPCVPVNAPTVALAIPVATLAASASYYASAACAFLRIIPTTAGAITIVLRSQPVPSQAIASETFIGISPAVAAGAVGVQAVGGNVATGLIATANPNVVAGVDSGKLIRSLLTDTSGKLLPSGVGLAGTSQTSQSLVTAVSDQTLIEGYSQAELLYLILVELRMQSRQQHEINFGTLNQTSDDPDALRLDFLAPLS